jgi:hypothetical protein
LLLLQLRRLTLRVERQIDEIGDSRRQRPVPANQTDHIGLDIESGMARRDSGRLSGL